MSLYSPVIRDSLGQRQTSSGHLTVSSKPASDSVTACLYPNFSGWLHLFHNGTFSSDRNTILPLSASPRSVSFKETELQTDPPMLSWRMRLPPFRSSILIVILLFPISSALVLFSLSTLPISVSWPHNISDLAQLGRELHDYCESGLGPMLHVVLVMSISAIWKHAWSIPGSVLWNVLAGALFPPFYATILLAVLTALGSACSTMLSKPLGPFVSSFSPRVLDATRHALAGFDHNTAVPQSRMKASPAWVRLSILRLIGVVPWSGINIACGVCNVPLVDCMLGAFLGCLPWTVVTCQIGDILQQVASTPSPTPRSVQSLITKPETVLKLVVLTAISLAPILGRSRFQNLIGSTPAPMGEKRVKWKWVRKWRSKIRMHPSSGPQPMKNDLQLETLVHEKILLEDLSSP